MLVGCPMLQQQHRQQQQQQQRQQTIWAGEKKQYRRRQMSFVVNVDVVVVVEEKNATAKEPNYQEKWKIINQPGSLIRAANNGKSCRWSRKNRQKEPIFEIHCCRKKTKNFGTFRCRVSSVRLEGVICCRTFFPITTKQQIGKKQNFLSSD